MNIEFAVSELSRRLSNMIRIGVISELDAEAARVKVNVAKIETEWLPWLTTRAGDDTSWWAPTVGEQVLVLSPSGELAAAMVIPAIYSNQQPANANTENIHRVTYADGTVIEYNKSESKLSVNCVGAVDVIASGDVTVETESNLIAQAAAAEITAATVTINGNFTVNGTVSVSGDITSAANISASGNITAAGALAGATIAAGGMSASGGAMSAGSVSASGDISAGGISLTGHVHGGITPGGGTTGAPQ